MNTGAPSMNCTPPSAAAAAIPTPWKTRAHLRRLFASVVIHPTERRAPYEVSAFGRLAAILGVPDVFPNYDNGNPLKGGPT